MYINFAVQWWFGYWRLTGDVCFACIFVVFECPRDYANKFLTRVTWLHALMKCKDSPRERRTGNTKYLILTVITWPLLLYKMNEHVISTVKGQTTFLGLKFKKLKIIYYRYRTLDWFRNLLIFFPLSSLLQIYRLGNCGFGGWS